MSFPNWNTAAGDEQTHGLPGAGGAAFPRKPARTLRLATPQGGADPVEREFGGGLAAGDFDLGGGITLTVRDLVPRLPAELLGEVEPFLGRKLVFRLDEVEPDISRGEATVPLGVVYNRCPEIFARPVGPDDPGVVPLPLDKLAELVAGLEGHPPAEGGEAGLDSVSARGGGSGLPEAETDAAAEKAQYSRRTTAHHLSRRTAAGGPQRSASDPRTAVAAGPAFVSQAGAGPGAGFSEGSGEDTPRSAPPRLLPQNHGGPAGTGPAEGVEAGGEVIPLPLSEVVRNLPPDLAALTPREVPAGAVIRLNLAQIEARLASGFVGISREEFLNALPVEMRPLFFRLPVDAPIPLPLDALCAALPEKPLPTGAAAAAVAAPPPVREGEQRLFEGASGPQSPAAESEGTFSGGAVLDEAAQARPERPALPPAFSKGSRGPAPRVAGLERQAGGEAPAEGRFARALLGEAAQEVLQEIFMTEEPLDAKGLVRQIARLPGLAGGLLLLGDEGVVAAQLPESYDADAVAAAARRAAGAFEETAAALGSGVVSGVTFYTDRDPVSVLRFGPVLLAVAHSRERFMPGVREKLMTLLRELSRLRNSAGG